MKEALSGWRRVLNTEGKIVIIDESWGDYSRLWRQIWRYFVSMPPVLITERRNSGHWHHNKEIEKQLPN